MSRELPVLLITGASSGIGEQTARRAADRYRLVLAARGTEALERLATELGGPESVLAVACDVTEWDSVEELAAAAVSRFGRIDAVFANAGVWVESGFLESSPDAWRQALLTNVHGVALTVRATLPDMLERGRGRFVITSSLAGRYTETGSLYSVSKFAAGAIAAALRSELREMHPDNEIGVTVIEPGAVDTPVYESSPEIALDADDVADAVLYSLERPASVDLNEIVIRPTRQRN